MKFTHTACRLPLAVLLVSAAGQAHGADAIPARPIGSPADWVSTADYPAAALRTQAQGTTGFRLTFGPDGVVNNCEVTVSSGSVDLDETTCRVVSARARFAAGKDGNGNAVGGTYSSKVHWAIPPGTQITAAGMQMAFPTQKQLITTVINIDATGRVESCQVTGASENSVASKACLMHPTGTMRGIYGIGGKPYPYSVKISQTVEIKPR